MSVYIITHKTRSPIVSFGDDGIREDNNVSNSK